jgi:hypothetical protein
VLVINGRYQWFRRRIAFRRDYCLHCDQPTIAVCHRTFDVLHLYWIPLLPIGFWRTWFCDSCGNKPSHPPRTRRSFKVAGIGVLAIMVALFWIAPLQEWDPEIGPAFVWALRILTALGLPLAIWNTLRSPPDVSYRKQRIAVEAYRDPTCPFCLGPLTLGKEWRCERCGLERK